jgi:hypothetical protein
MRAAAERRHRRIVEIGELERLPACAREQRDHLVERLVFGPDPGPRPREVVQDPVHLEVLAGVRHDREAATGHEHSTGLRDHARPVGHQVKHRNEQDGVDARAGDR